MDFRLSDEQRMFSDSTGRFLTDNYNFDTYLDAISNPDHNTAQRWQKMTELGWMAAPFPESVGGFGGSLIDVQLVARHLGERLCVDTWLTHVLLPGKVLEFVNTSLSLAFLESIVSGDHKMALAALEVGECADLSRINTRLSKQGENWVLNGHKSMAFGAKSAKTLLVTALDESGTPVLLALPCGLAGIELDDYRVLDGSRAAEVLLKDVKVSESDILAKGSAALDAITRAVDIFTAAQCADMFGAMSAVLQKTLEYARTRKQFGTTIGSFQVIQHYLVDMFVEVQQSESLVWMAGIRGDTADTAARQRAVSTAKAYLSKSAVAVAQKGIQIHGGIGMTEELDIGHYFRRITHYAAMYGGRDYHVSRCMSLSS